MHYAEAGYKEIYRHEGDSNKKTPRLIPSTQKESDSSTDRSRYLHLSLEIKGFIKLSKAKEVTYSKVP